eukprot:2774152-Alexandrium_andersonii.AAC.1
MPAIPRVGYAITLLQLKLKIALHVWQRLANIGTATAADIGTGAADIGNHTRLNTITSKPNIG